MIKKTLIVLALSGLALGGLVACDNDYDDRDCKRKNNTSQSLIVPEAVDAKGGKGGGGGKSGGGSKGGSSSSKSKYKSGSSGSNPVPHTNGSSGGSC